MAFSKDQLERLSILPVTGKGRTVSIAIEHALQPCANDAMVLRAHTALVEYHKEQRIIPITMLPVTKLIPTHTEVFPVKLKRLARADNVQIAIVWQHKRKYYILSGHHEIVTLMLLGDKKVPIRLVHYDA